MTATTPPTLARVEQPGSQAFTFSTDGKLAAINVNEIVRIWELASGRLLHEVEVGRFHPHTFRFADERQIVGKINGGVVIQAIDAPTGEQRKLMGPVGYESYGGAVRDGTFTLVSVGEVFSLSLKTGERTRLADVSPTSRMAPSRTWYSQDGGKLFIQRSELVQVLDMAKREYTALFQVTAPQKGHDIQALAEEAGLLVISQPKQVELWDAELGAVRTTVIPPSRLGRIGGISADGSKLILAQDEPGAVLLDFGGPPPAGEINVPKLIAEQCASAGPITAGLQWVCASCLEVNLQCLTGPWLDSIFAPIFEYGVNVVLQDGQEFAEGMLVFTRSIH